ncbi:SDR family NAD(P)-dependent oxidoreductase [Coraliomargarita akajimensis]|uniref:Short-chain dehydrogenase/reductase SDR n=1 Tax=Coraliomargarita akajimensis (strain DSM 45221 / IAM 15411 / JCM 23193 / KCTC 12865 / 04OKA010-24) TaxID=583355 RepID=D5EN84_CORAD|nr:SDR family NAD(P)-dependent oxidoreductase [Coraliomargarita akajimensis]ADE53519.1 short-chain dehydrogenase/reductase SDR [Coraliomargarita akajimensis DSM 45221]
MKTALITGADKGLGLGHANFLLAQGYRVVATSREPADSDTFQALQARHGDQFVPVRLDVLSDQSISALAATLEGETFDLVINNAGISRIHDLGEWTGDELAAHFRVNATGPALIAQVLEPQLRDGAKLINISSGMASLELNLNAAVGLDAYAMSKAALNMLSRRLAEKLRDRGIIVVALSPGWVQTAMGGAEAPATVEEAVTSMQAAIESLTLEQSGGFLCETGAVLPW